MRCNKRREAVAMMSRGYMHYMPTIPMRADAEAGRTSEMMGTLRIVTASQPASQTDS